MAPAPGLGIDVDAINRITFSGTDDGPITVTRAGIGKWHLADDETRAADIDRISRLLVDLNAATYTHVGARHFSATPYRLFLSTVSGATMTVELGRREEAFCRQTVRVDAQAYRIDRDLNACLGIWAGRRRPSRRVLLQPTDLDAAGAGHWERRTP